MRFSEKRSAGGGHREEKKRVIDGQLDRHGSNNEADFPDTSR